MRAPFTQLFIHLVWSTRDRMPIITPEIQPRLYACMAQRSKDLKCSPIAIGGIDNHVHLLVQLHPAVSVADLVKDIKGASSHLMNHEILLDNIFYWQGAYGAFSIRKTEIEQVAAYIHNQFTHHAQENLLPWFEQTDIPA